MLKILFNSLIDEETSKMLQLVWRRIQRANIQIRQEGWDEFAY